MDLRSYYKKVREADSTLIGDDIVLVSLATSEGGKEGVRTEAPRGVAAKLIAEGRARVASDDEVAAFRADFKTAREQYEQNEAARRVQVVLVPARSTKKSTKDRS
jgi:hypothetical protein